MTGEWCTAHLTSGDYCHRPAGHLGDHATDWPGVTVLWNGTEEWARA